MIIITLAYNLESSSNNLIGTQTIFLSGKHVHGPNQIVEQSPHSTYLPQSDLRPSVVPPLAYHSNMTHLRSFKTPTDALFHFLLLRSNKPIAVDVYRHLPPS